MKTINNFPDLGRAMKLFKISVDLEGVPDDTFFGHSIRIGLKEGKLHQCIDTIRSQAKDNRKLMIELIGEPLLKSIENL